MQVKRFDNHWWVHFDHKVSVEILTDGRQYHGLGRVKCDAVQLRSNRLPILPLIVTSDGYRVCEYQIRNVRQDEAEEKITLYLKPAIISCIHTERCDSRGKNLFCISEWPHTPAVDRGGELRIDLDARHMLVGGTEMRGFSYAYHFKSRKHTPCCIHDRASWEIDGRSTKNTILMGKNVISPYKKILTKEDSFTTAIYKPEHTTAQFRPAISEIQPFSCQFKNNSILVTAPAEPAPFHFLVEKQKNRNEIICWRQFYNTNNSGKISLNSPAIQVLYGENTMNCRTDQLNQYCSIRRDLLSTASMEDTKAAFQHHGPSGEISLSEQMTETEIEKGIKKLADSACSQVIISPQENCCPAVDMHNKSDAQDKYQLMLTKTLERAIPLAHRRGMTVALLWDKQLQGKKDTQSMKPPDSLFGFFEELHDRYGIARIYMCGDTPNQHALHKKTDDAFRTALNNKLGKDFCLLQPRLPAFPDQSAVLRYMLDNEFFYQNSSIPFPYEGIQNTGHHPAELFFRGCAHKIYYRPVYERQKNKKYDLGRWWTGQFTRINMALKAVQENMVCPHLLPENNGIIWKSVPSGEEAVKTLWSFDGFELHVGQKAQVYDVMQTRKMPVEDGMLSANPMSVYLIESDVE